MPILLNDLTNSNNMPSLKAYSPKFFDSKLTGAGKNTGLLKETVNPRWPNNDRPIMSENVRVHKRTSTNGSVTTTYIPVNPIDASAWEYMKVIPQPDLTTLTKIGLDNDYELYIDMKPHSVMLEETSVSNSQPSSQANGKTSGITRGLTVCYQLLFYNVYKKSDKPHKNVPFGHHSFFKQAENTYQTTMTCSPYADVQKIVADLTSQYTINPMDVTDWLNDYELYVGLCERSQQWQTTIDKDLDVLFENIENYSKSNGILSSTVEGIVSNVLRKLEDYSVPLDLYKNLYASVTKHFPNISHELCKQNLNLLLSDTLNSLHLNKPALTRIPAQNSNMTIPASVSRLSPEQYAAVSSTDSLILVQSGAGTGKALDLDTPVLTPTGWLPMRDIQIGDKVIGSDGKPHTVTGVWNYPDKKAYNLTFRDGSNVIACDEHLWQTYHVVKGETKPRTKAITTQEWIDNRKYKDYDFLPQVHPVEYEFSEKDLPLDPYFMGALLADGALGLNSIQYTKSEMPVVEEVRKHALASGFEMYDATCETSTANQWRFRHAKDTKGYSVLKDKLRDMDLLVKSHEKFIPDEYKTASIEQRKALLNGLFDGDGDIRTGRTYARYNTASDQMANDVLQILWSLGLSATKQRQTHSKGDYWSINLLDQSWDPFVASHCKGQHKGSVRPMRRSLVNTEYLGTRPMKCITVDAPDHLYVTKDFIVTHNSTTILSRIDYMVAVGVKPEDITVLSFTNAAADHIKERNPSVHSMTIARMIHTIYEKNFPTHELSSLDTIINSLEIYFPGDPDARQFAHYCKLLLKNDNNAFTAMNSYIEQNFDKVVKMLDRLKQTALELEIIVCYQKIDTLQEPAEVQSKFLIIDEVQDNSIFEFVYTLKYVDKHKESLFIVGRLQLPTLNPTNCGKLTIGIHHRAA